MKFRATILMCILSVTVLANPKMHGPDFHNRSAPIEGPRVRVLLHHAVNSAFLEVKGPYRIIRRDTSSVLSGGTNGKRFVVHSIHNGIRWGEEFPGTFCFTVIPAGQKTEFFVNGLQYKGAITVFQENGSQISLINEVAIEDFVKSTLAIKHQEALSREAMAALAIVERSKVYAKTQAAQRSFWDITAAEAGYFGYGVTKQKNGVDEAVDWTPFMVLQSKGGKEGLVDIRLPSSKAVELANMGCDAKHILVECFPSTLLGTTADPSLFSTR
ncbi:MAG: SpoIID/LytB domain-containing protein [Chlamydiales bacterium]